MRRRLIAALAGVAIATLGLYAGPRTFLLTDMVRDREELGLERTADLIAQAIAVRDQAGLETTDDDLGSLLGGRDDLEISLRRADGSRLSAGDVPDATSTVERALADGSVVTVELSAEAVGRRIADALVQVAGFAAVSTAFAVLVAVLLSRRLARPFARLAEHADRLDLDEEGPAPRSGVPEADHIAEALDRSQRRLSELLRDEREFSSNASHQLRTPLAALRLRIEDLGTWPTVDAEVRDELDDALAEVDRLADTVTDLLELARSGGMGGRRELDLEGVTAAAVARWQDRFDDLGRRIELAPSGGGVRATGSERAVRHVLDVLLENALSHGAGTVEVTVAEAADDVVVRVSDEGRFDQAMVDAAFTRSARGPRSTGSGIGLALARDIARSAGAELRLAGSDPTIFELALASGRGDCASSPDR